MLSYQIFSATNVANTAKETLHQMTISFQLFIQSFSADAWSSIFCGLVKIFG